MSGGDAAGLVVSLLCCGLVVVLPLLVPVYAALVGLRRREATQRMLAEAERTWPTSSLVPQIVPEALSPCPPGAPGSAEVDPLTCEELQPLPSAEAAADAGPGSDPAAPAARRKPGRKKPLPGSPG